MTLDRFAPAIFVFLWSTGWIIAKYAALHSEPFSFLVIRYALSAVAFCAISVAIRAKWPSGALAWRAVYSGAFLHGLYLGGVWWAVAHGVPAGISGIVAAMQPLLTALAARVPIVRRRPETLSVTASVFRNGAQPDPLENWRRCQFGDAEPSCESCRGCRNQSIRR